LNAFGGILREAQQTGRILEMTVAAPADEEGMTMVVMPSLTSGKIDVVAAAMFATAQRKEVIDFCGTVYGYGEGLIATARQHEISFAREVRPTRSVYAPPAALPAGARMRQELASPAVDHSRWNFSNSRCSALMRLTVPVAER
jgi:hypothetical protein